MKKQVAFLSIGTNLGNKIDNIKQAIFYLNTNEKIEILKLSSFYETLPYGNLKQDNFINIVVKIKTILKPLELLEFCQSVEQKMLRVKTEKWGERIIDLDIIMYENIKLNTKKLTIPHPYCHDRLFVLKPLLEIEKNLKVKDIINLDTYVETASFNLIKENQNCPISQWITKLDNTYIKKIESPIATAVFYSNLEYEKAVYTITISKSKNDNYILVKHKERTNFEIPGGKCETTNYLDEASRELEEETGTTNYEIKYFMSYGVDVDKAFNYTHIYLAKLEDYSVNKNFEMEVVEEFIEIPKKLNYELHRYILWLYEKNKEKLEQQIKLKFYW